MGFNIDEIQKSLNQLTTNKNKKVSSNLDNSIFDSMLKEEISGQVKEEKIAPPMQNPNINNENLNFTLEALKKADKDYETMQNVETELLKAYQKLSESK